MAEESKKGLQAVTSLGVPILLALAGMAGMFSLGATASGVATSILGGIEDINKKLDEAARERWTVQDQYLFCLRFEQLNQGMICPDVYDVRDQRLQRER